MDNCLFCKIVNGEVSSYTVYEDEIVKVFLDIYPESDGHMLIVTKKHILDLTQMDNDTFKHINTIIKKMDNLLKERLNIDGLKLVQNNGICQDVKHYHMHLIPKYTVKLNNTSVEEIFKLLNS